MPEFISRSEAQKRGLRKYFTGKQCPNGHIALRRVSNHKCVECEKTIYHPKENEKKRERYASDDAYREEALKSSRKRHIMIMNDDNLLEEKRARGRKYVKERYKTNPEFRNESIEKIRQWKKENRDKHRIQAKRRKAKLKGAPGNFTIDDIRSMINNQGGQCVYCHDNLDNDYHVDHKTPVSRGGANYPENLQILCPSCNLRKGAKTHEEMMDYING